MMKLEPTASEDHAVVGGVVWITGLSGSGKSATAKHLALLLKSNQQPVLLLDGDELRAVFEPLIDREKSFEPGARMMLATTYSNLCNLLARQGFNIVIATISLFDEIHALNRLSMPNYFEVYLDVPLEVLKQRDVKGIYENFQQNRLFNVVGGDIKFHIPKNLDLIINYHPDDTPESNAAKIFELIQERPTV